MPVLVLATLSGRSFGTESVPTLDGLKETCEVDDEAVAVRGNAGVSRFGNGDTAAGGVVMTGPSIGPEAAYITEGLVVSTAG